MKYFSLFLILFSLASCQEKQQHISVKTHSPRSIHNGEIIYIPDTSSFAFFRTSTVTQGNISAEFSAPAKIAATVLSSASGAGQNIILFDNPELAGNYTQLIQHQMNIRQILNINIKQRQLELQRTKDLNNHGAATGQELLNAETALSMEQTNLANEKAGLNEHESKLISAGFSPDILRTAKPGTAFVICEIPENQITRINKGNTCNIVFTAFPEEVYKGKIDAVADVVDNVTRMVKIRISIDNSSSKLKAGMFANVSFGLDEGNFITVTKDALATVQGNNYVFVKQNDSTFLRRKVETGQQIGDRIIIYNGLSDQEEIAVKGVMQLKGLSFGY